MASETPPLPPKYLQQEQLLSQEFKTFLSTLPKHTSHLYQYQGFWFPATHLCGVISCQQHFHPQPSDVLLVATPKSGTTWLKSIMFTLLNRGRHPVDKNHPLLTTNPHQLVPFLEQTLYVDTQTSDLATVASPRLLSSHMPWAALPEGVRDNSSACKIVYLCRNPKDTFVSMWHFMNRLGFSGMETKTIEEAFDQFSNGISVFGPYWDHVLGYWKPSRENPDRILFLTYEDMKQQSGMHLRSLAEFLDCPFSEEEEKSGLVEEIQKLCSLENLSGLDVNKYGVLSFSSSNNNAFFRRGVVGDWKNYLTGEMAQQLDRISGDKFSKSGLLL